MFESFKGERTQLSLLLAFTYIGFFISNPVCGNSVVPIIKQLSINEGISNSRITTIFQDSRGFLWVGTQDGLNRYDGYEFREYKHDPLDSATISGNFIQSIIETPNGDIWVGTKDNGIAIWNRKTNSFSSLYSVLPENMQLSESDIHGMAENNGFVWAVTPNYLVKISISLDMIAEYNHYNNVFKSGRYNSYPVVFRNDGEVWIGSKDGLLIFDLKKEAFSKFQKDGIFLNDDISTLMFAEDSTVFIGSDKGFKRIDLKTNDLSYIWAGNSQVGAVSINCIARSIDDELWLGTQKGVELCKYPFSSHSVYNEGKKGWEPIKNMQITSMLFDQSGILWVGTKNMGLIKIILAEPKFHSISASSDEPFNLNTYNFTAVLVDKDGVLWLGTDSDGLYRIGKEHKSSKHYNVNSNLEYGFEDKVDCILEGEDGFLWLGTPYGMFKVNKSTGVVREFDYAGSIEFANLLRHNSINDLLMDRLGDIWIATDFGLYKYDKEKIISFFEDTGNPEEASGLCSDVVNVLHEDKQGWMWIGTKKGVNYLKRAGEKFRRISNIQGEELQLSDNDIISFGEGKGNVIWIGTRSGLSYFDKAKLKSGFLNDEKVLKQTMINNVILDDYNRIWIGANKGIYYISSDGKVFPFTEMDGLPGYAFNTRSAFKWKSQLYFGGVEGLAFLNADSIQDNMVIPNVVVTGVDVLHKGKVINQYHGEVSEVEFKYKKNTIIKVDFAALEFTQPEHNWYKIKLENYDEDWREETQVNSVSFSNLSPGVYHLKILGANNDFIWNNKPQELIIKIIHPLWMTGFAYIFYILLSVFIIQLIINFSVRKYRIENKRLKEETDNKHRIEKQKESLTKINRSLTDSISYAKRIQEAIIPSEQVFRKLLSESFVYFDPKDIVSGDFYWIFENRDKIFVSAIDCTGHGVPGAFMSIVGHGILRNIVEIQGVECSAEVLNRMNEEVLGVFKKNNLSTPEDSSLFEVNDGMDMVFCVIDKKRKIMEFAGAKNPIYLIRDNEIFTFKGDRFSIGHNSGRHFRKEEIQLLKDDIIYLFTDGYADQFGGPEDKKFKYRRFRHLLLNIHKLPMSDQKAILHQKMEDWKNYQEVSQEQIDDILIVGIRPLS